MFPKSGWMWTFNVVFLLLLLFSSRKLFSTDEVFTTKGMW